MKTIMNPLIIDQPKKIQIRIAGPWVKINYVTHDGRVIVTGGLDREHNGANTQLIITDRLDAIIAGLKDRKGAGRPRPFATVFHDGSMFHTDEGTIHYSPLDPSRDLRAQIAPRTTEITTDQALTDEIIVNGEKYKKA